MGLTNLDVTDVGHGIEVSNTYVYIKDIKIQNDVEFNVYCNAEEHVSRENKNAGKRMIKNLNVNYRIIRSFEPLLKISENADAIFVSDSKNLELNPYWGAYNISKLGLEALVNTWKKEINLTNIKAHIFIPDDMDTKLRSSFMPGEKNKNLKQPDEIASKLIKLIRKI